MGVKIRKEDSARIHGDHLRYKGRRSVFPPLYLSSPHVPAPSAVLHHIHTHTSESPTYICTHVPHSWVYIRSARYIEINIYIQVHTHVYVYVYCKHVYCIVLNPLTYSGLSLREIENFPRKALVKFSIFPTCNASSKKPYTLIVLPVSFRVAFRRHSNYDCFFLSRLNCYFDAGLCVILHNARYKML